MDGWPAKDAPVFYACQPTTPKDLFFMAVLPAQADQRSKKLTKKLRKKT
jgi:hypothetical protein